MARSNNSASWLESMAWIFSSGNLEQVFMMTFSNGNIFRVTGLCEGNSPVPGEFPSQRPVTLSFDVLFDLGPNKPLSKQLWGWWFETPSRSLWRHSNVKSILVHYIGLVWFIRQWSEQKIAKPKQILVLAQTVYLFLKIWWSKIEIYS